MYTCSVHVGCRRMRGMQLCNMHDVRLDESAGI